MIRVLPLSHSYRDTPYRTVVSIFFWNDCECTLGFIVYAECIFFENPSGRLLTMEVY